MASKNKLILRSLSALLACAFFSQELSYAAPLEMAGQYVAPIDRISQDPTLFEAPADFVSKIGRAHV